MVTWSSARAASRRTTGTMQGFGVNTYRWVNAAGRDRPGQVPLDAEAGRQDPDRRATPPTSRPTSSATHTKDLYEAIERGDYPEWELCVQIMSDDEHPELDFDPLDDTKIWPEDQFPLRPVGRMVLDRNPDNFFAEIEQIAFGTGVLVDGLDFSDDKMLVGPDVLLLATPSATGSAPTTCSCRSTSAKNADGRDQPARRPDDLPRRRRGRQPARQLRAVDHRRAARGARAGARRAGPGRSRAG